MEVEHRIGNAAGKKTRQRSRHGCDSRPPFRGWAATSESRRVGGKAARFEEAALVAAAPHLLDEREVSPRLEVGSRGQDAAVTREHLRREEGILVHAVEARHMRRVNLGEDGDMAGRERDLVHAGAAVRGAGGTMRGETAVNP